MHKNSLSAGGAYSVLSGHLAVFKGPTSKEKGKEKVR